MLFTSTVAVLALAAQSVLAEPMPYKPAMMKMSLRQLGLVRRDDGYTPQQTQCGSGNTCAEACGAGYQTCASSDAATHCYNPAANESCCPDGSGNSCQAGYYCTHDTTNTVFCCPNGMGLAACAAAYSAKGSLVSETPTPTPASSSAAPSMPVTTATDAETTTYCPSSGLSTALPTNGTTTSHRATPTASTSTVPTSGADVLVPALGLVAAGVFALFV